MDWMQAERPFTAPRLEKPFPTAQYDVTRLADFTGLDDIGLPVWAAIRPGARSFSQTQGKGLGDGQAQISALMEAAETALAEQADRLVCRIATVADLCAEGVEMLALDSFHKCRNPQLVQAKPLQWLVGHGLHTGAQTLVPLEAVSLDFRVDGPCDHDSFILNSVGLAAHWRRDAAVLHGLLEAVEYDAVALSGVWPGILPACPSPNHLPHLDLMGAVELVQAAGLEAVFRDITSDLGLPVVLCWLTHRGRAGLRVSAGHACRFGLADAALAALLEAVQSRMTDISGAREDIAAEDYDWHPAPVVNSDQILTSLVRSSCPKTATAGIAEVLVRFDKAGLPEPVVVDLSKPGDSVACVAVLCPGLEAGAAKDGFRTGPRARSRLLRHTVGMP